MVSKQNIIYKKLLIYNEWLHTAKDFYFDTFKLSCAYKKSNETWESIECVMLSSN